MNLALYHLFAACRFAESVRVAEEGNADAEFGEFWSEILENSLGVVTMSVAALECYANEYYADGRALDCYVNHESALLITDLIDKKGILDKYNLLLALRSGKQLDPGQDLVQRVNVLIKLRNAIVHFRPEWFHERHEHDKLTRHLEARFKKSPFLPNDPMFPRAWASASCAGWSISTVVGFIDYFCIESRLENPLTLFRARLDRFSNRAL